MVDPATSDANMASRTEAKAATKIKPPTGNLQVDDRF